MHTTEIDGLKATWRLDHHPVRIGIMAVYNTAENLPLTEFDHRYPDLTDAREQLPELWRLWDAVCHDMWVELMSPRFP
ncbi:hypothetical protein [Nocardia sp. NPDC051570]|uniref:hypothetical protein n=1 Tax=Nocardia sp. NPDC051570 TaxID=3364324 RepID=UPI0037881254